MVLDQIPEYSQKGNFDAYKEAQKIVTRVAGLALGISASIGRINATNWTLEQYNAENKSGQDVLLDVSMEDSHRNFAPYPSGLREVLTESVTSLERDARSLLEVISLIDPDQVQDYLLEKATKVGSLRDLGFVKNRHRCIGALSHVLLRNSSHEGQNLPSFHIHRLLQDWVQMNMTTQSRQCSFNLAVQILCSVLGPDPPYSAKWPVAVSVQFKEYFPHVQSLHEYYQKHSAEGQPTRLTATVYVIEMLRKASW